MTVSLWWDARDHPRIRGEHEAAKDLILSTYGSSPHTRGARLIVPAAYTGLRIIPAYAGSTFAVLAMPAVGRDHPRIRGEHVRGLLSRHAHGGSSPHTRGALLRLLHSRARRGIIPAYAGSTRRGSPRLAVAAGSSPHTRGAPAEGDLAQAGGGIIPAYAGSTPGSGTIAGSSQDHPRIRGEHDLSAVDGGGLPGSSPHTRGARRGAGTWCHRRWIIPAYAGSTTATSRGRAERGDHPRIRGEHSLLTTRTTTHCGSSPHTRGALGRIPARLDGGRIIPAYAGSTLYSHFGSKGIWDHPRIRGEHKPISSMKSDAIGSSPHTRGARSRGRWRTGRQWIIPAYAGSTVDYEYLTTYYEDHPRIRGEHRMQVFTSRGVQGSSPHTRGAHRHRPARRHGSRIIPAYAGSTRGRPQPPEGRADHPRIRGEHFRYRCRTGELDGSSPHTRGARSPARPVGKNARIIPAYAGSTFCGGGHSPRLRDHPRIRGEHGIGWAAPGISGGIIPAYAGSTAPRRTGRFGRTDHPRIRGEHEDAGPCC